MQYSRMHLFYYIVMLNGIYDILSFLILLLPNPPFISPHLFMFFHLNQVSKRLLGYWILTYGLIRLFYPKMAFITYLIEAVCILMETLVYKTIDVYKGSSVSFACLVFSYLYFIF